MWLEAIPELCTPTQGLPEPPRGCGCCLCCIAEVWGVRRAGRDSPPAPHVWEHCDQADHGESWQSTAHPTTHRLLVGTGFSRRSCDRETQASASPGPSHLLHSPAPSKNWQQLCGTPAWCLQGAFPRVQWVNAASVLKRFTSKHPSVFRSYSKRTTPGFW